MKWLRMSEKSGSASVFCQQELNLDGWFDGNMDQQCSSALARTLQKKTHCIVPLTFDFIKNHQPITWVHGRNSLCLHKVFVTAGDRGPINGPGLAAPWHLVFWPLCHFDNRIPSVCPTTCARAAWRHPQQHKQQTALVDGDARRPKALACCCSPPHMKNKSQAIISKINCCVFVMGLRSLFIKSWPTAFPAH